MLGEGHIFRPTSAPSRMAKSAFRGLEASPITYTSPSMASSSSTSSFLLTEPTARTMLSKALYVDLPWVSMSSTSLSLTTFARSNPRISGFDGTAPVAMG